MEPIERILEFWFGTVGEDGRLAEGVTKRWWRKDPEFDAEIRDTFGSWLEQAAGGELSEWATKPRGRLALIVLLDQFSRNAFRDTPQAFAQDALACKLCREGMDAGHDRELVPQLRQVFYMPLMHSEDRDVQQQAIDAFEALAAEGPDVRKWAVAHADIVKRFGRFPHRNRILGRESTAEELEFLEQPGSSF